VKILHDEKRNCEPTSKGVTSTISKKRNKKNQVNKEKKTKEEEKWSFITLNRGHFRKPPTSRALLLSWQY